MKHSSLCFQFNLCFINAPQLLLLSPYDFSSHVCDIRQVTSVAELIHY